MLLRIAIVLLAVGAIVGVGRAIAWHYNDDHDRTRTVEYRLVNQDGTPVNNTGGSVVVVRDDHWRGRPFFPAFPLLVFGGVLLTVALVSRGRHRSWNGPRGPFEDWHRDAHRNDPPPPPATPAA